MVYDAVASPTTKKIADEVTRYEVCQKLNIEKRRSIVPRYCPLELRSQFLRIEEQRDLVLKSLGYCPVSVTLRSEVRRKRNKSGAGHSRRTTSWKLGA